MPDDRSTTMRAGCWSWWSRFSPGALRRLVGPDELSRQVDQ